MFYLGIDIGKRTHVASVMDDAGSFYEKKRAEGKHHLIAIGALSRKLCYIIHAILTKNEPYEIRQ